MAGENRGPAADLNEPAPMNIGADLLDRGWSYSFFQAVRLLRRLHSDGGTSSGTPEDRIRVRPDLNLSFPAADIAKIEADESGIYY